MDFKTVLKKLLPDALYFGYHSINITLRNLPLIKQMSFKRWVNNGSPLPPPHIVKQKNIREYADKYKLKTLVETGTFLGEMVYSQKDNFDKIFSIELSQKLHKRAVKKFEKNKNVEILLGDSSKVLKELADSGKLNSPSLFWLDGHYSAGFTALGEKETPILEELETIFRTNQKHVILIDDARCFKGENDYPTIEELSNFIKSKNSNYVLTFSEDIIKVTPDY